MFRVLLILSASATLSAQIAPPPSMLYSIPKLAIWGPVEGLNVDLLPDADLDGNPSTLEGIAYAFGQVAWAGYHSTVIYRNGFYCKTGWWPLPVDQSQVSWVRFVKIGGVTRIVVQTTLTHEARVYEVPQPASCP